MFIRSFSIAGALLLGAAPLVAQTTPGAATSTAAGVVDPNTPADPAPAPLSGRPAPKQKSMKSKSAHATPSAHADKGMTDQNSPKPNDHK